MPEQFACIKERIENKPLISYLGEEQVLLTYYKNSYLYKNYITVADKNPLNETIICTEMLLIIKERLSLVM